MLYFQYNWTVKEGTYLNKHDVLYENQYGLRMKHSTQQAIIQLVDKITTAIELKQYTIGIFLDCMISRLDDF